MISKRSIVMLSNQFHQRKQLKTSTQFNSLFSLLLLSISPTLIASIKELRHYENVVKKQIRCLANEIFSSFEIIFPLNLQNMRHTDTVFEAV